MGTFIGTLSGGLMASYAKTSDLTTILETINHTFSSTYTNGTGANQANAFWSDTRTLSSTNETLDLNSGVLADAFGVPLVFTSVKFLYVKNKSTTAGQRLVLTGDFLNGVVTSPLVGSTNPSVSIGPSGYALFESPIDGFLVTSTTSDALTITNTAEYAYDILILGIV